MGFLITLFGRREKPSSSVAKDRLLEVLIHDRIKLPPDTMEKIREEILGVLSKYIDVDPQRLEMSITRADGSAHLTANIPIRRGEPLDLMHGDDEEETGPAPARAGAPANPSASARAAAPDSGGSARASLGPESAASSHASSPPAQFFGPQPKKKH